VWSGAACAEEEDCECCDPSRYKDAPTHISARLDASLGTHHALCLLLEARARHIECALTQRQLAIVVEISAGFTNGQIARRLDISDATLSEHIRSIKDRLIVEDRVTIGIIGFLWLEGRMAYQSVLPARIDQAHTTP
jgi:DNA-binding CsgD family transcriptional regulator